MCVLKYTFRRKELKFYKDETCKLQLASNADKPDLPEMNCFPAKTAA
jgi:hypothetical protein